MTSLSKSVNELFAESGVLLYLLRYLDEPPFAEDIKPEKLTDASVYFYFFVVYFKTSLTNFFQEKNRMNPTPYPHNHFMNYLIF